MKNITVVVNSVFIYPETVQECIAHYANKFKVTAKFIPNTASKYEPRSSWIFSGSKENVKALIMAEFFPDAIRSLMSSFDYQKVFNE